MYMLGLYSCMVLSAKELISTQEDLDAAFIYLVSKNKIKILHNKKTLSFEEALSKFQRKNKNFYQKYLVFENLREKGYVVKDALKFGAEFRVYEKSKTKHAKWIVFVQKESDKINWTEFSSKNRVAHSTKKNLLLAVVGMEGTIVYYEVNWIKP